MNSLILKFKNNKKSIIYTCLCFFILLFLEWLFFKNVIGNGNMFGDNGDGRLTMLLNEHWYRFFQRKESFTELLQFSPLKSTLGYTDIFLGTGIVYSLFRAFSLDMYDAFKVTILLFHIFGTLSMFYLLKKGFKLNYFWSFFGTIIFSFSATFYNSMMHTQIIVLCCLPLLMLFVIKYINNFKIRWKRNLYFVLFAFQFSFIAYTAWYIAYFAYLFIIILLIVFIVKIIINRIKIFSNIKYVFKTINFDLIWYFVLLIGLVAPFAYIYLIALKSSSGDFGKFAFSSFTLEFTDLFNLGNNDLLLGWLFQKDLFMKTSSNGDGVFGYSLFLICIILCFSIIYFINKRKEKFNFSQIEKFFISSCLFSVLISIIFLLRLNSNGFSLWGIIYYIIPFSKSIRAVSRYLIWLLFPISICISYLGNKYYSIFIFKLKSKDINNKINKKGKALILSLFGFISSFLIISNINKIGVNSNWQKTNEINFLEKVNTPPPEVKYFFITDSSKKSTSMAAYQLDAFSIANKYNLKTFNGYSGLSPDDWGLWDINSSEYIKNIEKWVRKHNLSNVYNYDEGTNSWVLFK